MTKVMGVLRDVSGVQAAYAIPVVCYVGVMLYAWLVAEPKTGEAGA
ncbi:hypothetical protein SBA5_130028 [Candidatus Sulfotelmatomonas gaucii]|uniref:Uncharacterized protein n=1 Tax=Candidatus Sulfuritelmatomonas gaucii TaxID=2043161 RepID=A0A2N9L4D0_9BACT|nr:hypothetical protein SBA5_130028 [Candidatus Sulfotelmatomonas gaucii]